MSRHETFYHQADVGIRGRGPTLAQAFEQGALALVSVITDPAGVACRERVQVHCDAPDAELLFLDWINALIFEMATRRMVFRQFDVSIEGGSLEATACGEPVEVARHQPAVEIKGATFTELRVATDGDEWVAQCVVDV